MPPSRAVTALLGQKLPAAVAKNSTKRSPVEELNTSDSSYRNMLATLPKSQTGNACAVIVLAFPRLLSVFHMAATHSLPRSTLHSYSSFLHPLPISQESAIVNAEIGFLLAECGIMGGRQAEM